MIVDAVLLLVMLCRIAIIKIMIIIGRLAGFIGSRQSKRLEKSDTMARSV